MRGHLGLLVPSSTKSDRCCERLAAHTTRSKRLRTSCRKNDIQLWASRGSCRMRPCHVPICSYSQQQAADRSRGRRCEGTGAWCRERQMRTHSAPCTLRIDLHNTLHCISNILYITIVRACRATIANAQYRLGFAVITCNSLVS